MFTPTPNGPGARTSPRAPGRLGTSGFFFPSWDSDVNRMAALSTNAPRVPWDRFVTDRLRLNPGEHVGMLGPTGQGKTNLLLNLLPYYPYVVVFATKPKDKTMDALASRGYLKMDRWQSIDPVQFPKRILWPDATRLNARETQKAVFTDAFDKIYREGGWAVAIDEAYFMSKILGLSEEIRIYLLQSRSLGITTILATQRPAWVPREIYTACEHLFFWRFNEREDLASISGIGARDAVVIREIVSNLDRHQILYLNTRTGDMVRTRPPLVRIENGGR